MNQATKNTLAAIANCVKSGAANIETALESAYRIGKLDGGIEMARVGEDLVESLREAA